MALGALLAVLAGMSAQALAATSTLVGNLTLFCDPENLTAQTNIVVGDREWWGRGIVPEIRAAVLDFAFEKLGIEKIWGVPFARNFPALYNYKAQGFTCEGILRANKRLPDGSRVDQYYFGLLREEWRPRRGAGAGGAGRRSGRTPPPRPGRRTAGRTGS